MTELFRRIITQAAPLVLALVMTASLAWAQDSGRNIKMDFEQIDIRVLINFISELTGKNFVIDDKVGGKITVRSPSGISPDEAYRVFESVLEVHGFTVMPSGSIYKIIPAGSAKQRNIEVLRAGDSARGDDRVVTQLIFLKNASAREVYKILVPFISPAGAVLAYPPTELLILTDYNLNVQRLAKIIQEIDLPMPPDARIQIIPLTHAGADKTAEKISTLLMAQPYREDVPRESVFKLVSDARTNSLLFFGTETKLKMVTDLVKAIDQPLPPGQGNVNVIYLQNADATDLAKVVAGLPIKTSPDGPAGEKKEGQAAAPAADVRVVADKATNSLVITASPEEFRVLETIVKQLDLPRRQVFVEAAIMEVTTNSTLNFGINWNIGRQYSNFLGSDANTAAFAGSNPTSLSGLTAIPNGLTLGLLSEPFKIGNITVNNVATLIQAAQSDTNINLISTPQLMTLDNEEAKVVVAQNIPYSTRVDSGTSTTDRSIQSFEYKDVGVTLKVTPQISSSGTVRMKIFEEVSRIVSKTENVGGATGNVIAPTTTKRTAETRVEVPNGQTIVIAGLLGTDSKTDDNKVPGLGDVPGFGWLFKARNKEANKTNLLVFLTPHVVETVEDSRKIYREKVEKIDILRMGQDGQVTGRLKPAIASAPVVAQ